MGPSGKRLDQALREDAYRDHENALPLLQFTLHELFQRRLGKELTYVAYEQLGGLAGSVATTADAVLKAEGLEDRTVSHLFRNLISVDDAGGASRRYARMAEIEEDPAQRRLLLRLVEARLCVSDQREGEAVVAIAHEAMLRTWPVLVEWLKQEAGLLQTRELAQRETRLWQQHGQFDDWLAAADKLAAFKQLETDGIALSEPVRNFIARSAQRERRATRIKQASVGAIALLAIFASVAGWVASRKQHEAEYQTSEALHAQARLLTEAAAQRLSDNDLAGAQGIILEVLRDPKYAARSNPDAINVFQEMRAADKQIAVLSGHTGFVEFAAYSPDGARIVTASDDKTARIWDARSGKQLAILSGHEGAVNHVTYSPDGNRIVTASNDKTTRVWDARTGAQLLVLVGHDAFVNFAVYSTDGARIVTASDDKTARIWDARTGLQLAVLSGHGSSVRSAMFAPDGTHVVTASHDYTARIWDARSGAQLAVLSAGPALLESAAYSPDGARIVTTSRDKTARLWDAHTRAPLHVLTGHGTAVMSAAFSPDAGRIVTVSFDRTIRFWDSNTGVQLGVLSGHGDRIHSVAFSPDGTRIVTASFDKTARVWDARPDARIAMLSVHPGNIGSAKYSPDGTRILLASNNETASIWDARTNSELAVLSGHGGVEMAGYSSDGTRVVTASTDKTAGVWDAVTGTRLGTLSGHAGQVECAAYSPDGTHIVTASDDTTARVWDAHTFAPLAVLTGHTASVRWAVYSRDGSRIVTASWDKTARVWDARTGALIAVLAGHSGSVSSIDYSPDGRSIATASYDRTGRIWDAHTFAPLAVLSGHRGVVESVAYSPDGSRIVTASMDKTVRVWDAVTGTQLAVLAGHDDLIETAAFSPDASRIVSASDDGTARIWDARAAADINAQILWEAAAQTDPLSDIDRNKLGLTRDSHARSWSGEQSACDQAAAAYYDPDRDSPGVATASIAPDVANSACSAEIKKPEHSARMDYQMGRVLIAKRDVRGARQLFERAVSKGYRVARIDLADLQKDDSSGEIDVVRAVALYARAWKDHVPLAAYELGHLYETGAPSAAAESHSIAHPDLEMAWSWYQKGANAGEPTALARFAERDEMNALLESDASKRSALLLQAFRYYAAAAERARNENWPDDAWRHWRYRRATLARLLAREGMMQQVAGAYATARNM
jgi:WD40 repeat protein